MSAAVVEHRRYQLQVSDLAAPLDVRCMALHEALSQPFRCEVEFTSTDLDIATEHILCRDAQFTISRPQPVVYMAELAPPVAKPYRQLHGVITRFERLGASRDEARYKATLQPRLALLERGRQYRIYQRQSVPEIVEQILRSRHAMRGQDFLFDLGAQYPRREQVMQYGESDLAFIDRLLAEVGIWYRFTTDERLGIDVVQFHDASRSLQFGACLPNRAPAGMAAEQASVWGLQAHHQVVEQRVSVRAYDPSNANNYLDAEVDQHRGSGLAYGEAYHYADGYSQLGEPLARLHDHELARESGYFYARLAHERYLNGQTRLSGLGSCPELGVGQVLEVSEDVPQAFQRRVVIVRTTASGGCDRAFQVQFEGIPYADNYCYRPALRDRPRIAGTLAARICSNREHDTYGHIDDQGRYRVQFLFDRDSWKPGLESAWLRLARPYAGDGHGLHLPLLHGTEVAVAFEQGDPDRPYIAYALHDSRHPDHVTLRNYKRNVLRTPANNKLRLDDSRGQEHIKLSTEHGGKSQLNLGHLVGARRQPRGEGFELRSDAWGAVRAGSGLFISADAQPMGDGQALQMDAPMHRLQAAAQQTQALSDDAQACQAGAADVQAQLQMLSDTLQQLKASVLLLSAPDGIAASSGGHLQLAAERNLMLNAGGNADISVGRRLFMGIGQGLSLFVRKMGFKLVANQGPVQLQAQNGPLEILARQGLHICSSEDEVSIVARKKITLNAGGSYLTLDPCCIELGTRGDCNIKSAHLAYSGPASMKAAHPSYPSRQSPQPVRLKVFQAPNLAAGGWLGMPYTLYADGQVIGQGVMDASGEVQVDHQVVTLDYRLVMASGAEFSIPVPTGYRNPEQGQLANRGLHKADSHPGQRERYARALNVGSQEPPHD